MLCTSSVFLAAGWKSPQIWGLMHLSPVARVSCGLWVLVVSQYCVFQHHSPTVWHKGFNNQLQQCHQCLAAGTSKCPGTPWNPRRSNDFNINFDGIQGDSMATGLGAFGSPVAGARIAASPLRKELWKMWKKSQAGLQATQVTAGATSQATPWRRAFAVLENFDASEVWSKELRGFLFFLWNYDVEEGKRREERRKGRRVHPIHRRQWNRTNPCGLCRLKTMPLLSMPFWVSRPDEEFAKRNRMHMIDKYR